MSTHALVKGFSVLVVVLLGVLMVFVVAPGPVSAAPASAASTSAGSWSYGIVKSVSVPLEHSSDGWLYEGNATFGYTVTIYENSTSPTTFELTVYRTMGVRYTVRFCDLSCSTPVQWANQSYRLYEATATFANFTSQGKVYANGTSSEVSALALENTTSFLHANLTESTDVYLPAAGDLGPHVGYLGANLVADATVSFSPFLGLIPEQLIPGSTWNSTSEFTAMGSGAWNYYYSLQRPIGPEIIGPVTGGDSLSATGAVSVQGAYPTGSTFQYGGTTYPAIVLTISGPFDVREGVIFVPVSVDVFGPAAQPWASNATGTASVQMATLDVKLTGGDRLQPIASSWQYSSAAANAASPATVDPASSGLSAAATASNPVASGTIQGVPETSDQANGAESCLTSTSGAGCPGLSSSTPRSLLGLIVVSGVVATVAVLVTLAVVTRRRRVPPPVYPNATLYPPGAAHPSAPAGAPATPAAPTAPEDDPLDHLW